MPKFLENKLRAEAAAKGFTGRHADAYVYGAMNNMGAMKGNQPTAKGEAMEAKHVKDTSTKQLHPAMVRHGRLVAEAHTHLNATVPEYRQASPRQRMLMTQEHVRTRKANGY
jgi:hypothetical protein